VIKKSIDCMFIGHNEMDFRKYEKNVRKMGLHSGAYRDLNKGFIQYNNQPFHAAEIFNIFYPEENFSKGASEPPLKVGETFSAAIAYLGTYLHRRGYTFDYVNSFQDKKD
jgi:anaerobic magnesium-protoporphyrin IX monomethyl ester cyclase